MVMTIHESGMVHDMSIIVVADLKILRVHKGVTALTKMLVN